MSGAFEVISAASSKRGWDVAPIWTIATRVDRTGFADAELLSVYRDWGVVRKADRDDNFNVESEDLSNYKYVRSGDLVLNKMKTWQGSLAVSDYEGIVSPAYFTCTLSPKVHPRYIHYLLRSDAYIAMYAAASKGIRPNQWDLPFDEFRGLPALLPPGEEQRSIADFLDDQVARIDAVVDVRSRQVEFIEQLQNRKIAAEALGGGHVTAAPSTPYAGMPSHWSLQRLGTVWNVIDCKHRTPDYVDHGYPVVSPGDVRPGRLSLVECTRFVSEEDYLDLADDLRQCQPGDLVFSRNASMGKAALVLPGQEFTMGQDVCRITSVGADQSYLGHVLNYLVTPQLEALRIGSTITRVNIADIKSLVVPVPPLAEQQSRGTAVWKLLDAKSVAMQQVQDSLALLNEYKRSLITAAVTGEFDVSSASGRGIPA